MSDSKTSPDKQAPREIIGAMSERWFRLILAAEVGFVALMVGWP